jgi:hypothetical protein
MKVSRADSGWSAIVSEVKNSGLIERMRAMGGFFFLAGSVRKG